MNPKKKFEETPIRPSRGLLPPLRAREGSRKSGIGNPILNACRSKTFFFFPRLLALFCASAALAGTLADPTQPPAGFAGFAQEGETVATAREAGRPLAVIGGQPVRLGDYLGERRLIRVTEREAVLQGPAGIERLFLTPGIAKTAPGGVENEAKTSSRTIRGSKP